MTNAVPDPANELILVTRRVAAGWLRCLASEVIADADLGPDDQQAIDAAVATSEARLLATLESLLSLDVDAQRMNPLAVFRAATTPLTNRLAALGVPPSQREPFEVERFPDDVYGFGPATWGDVHADLVAVGLAWGAWKAMTVMQRRRSEAAPPEASPESNPESKPESTTDSTGAVGA